MTSVWNKMEEMAARGMIGGPDREPPHLHPGAQVGVGRLGVACPALDGPQGTAALIRRRLEVPMVILRFESLKRRGLHRLLLVVLVSLFALGLAACSEASPQPSLPQPMDASQAKAALVAMRAQNDGLWGRVEGSSREVQVWLVHFDGDMPPAFHLRVIDRPFASLPSRATLILQASDAVDQMTALGVKEFWVVHDNQI